MGANSNPPRHGVVNADPLKPASLYPEGWKLYAAPGPNFKGAVESASADSPYYNFVDQFDMLGLGKDVSIATGNESEVLLALVDFSSSFTGSPNPPKLKSDAMRRQARLALA